MSPAARHAPVAAGDAFLLTSQFAAAALFLILAVAVLVAKFNSRVNRAFAVFLLLRGGNLLFLAFARLEGPASPAYGPLLDSGRYLVHAIPFTLLYFATIYLLPQGGLRVRAIGIFCILGVILVDAVYLVDHCAAACTTESGVGPLNVVAQAVPLAEACTALLLATRASRLVGNPRGPATAIVASAFALLALLESAPSLVTLASNGSGTFGAAVPVVIGRLELLLAFGVGLFAGLQLLRTLQSFRRQVLFAASAMAVVATAVYVTASETLPEAQTQVVTLTTFLFGLWRLSAAAVVAYALVRHRFLDLDLRINWTISRGTVATAFLLVFLVVSQLIERMASEKLGYLSGALAAGVLLLAIKPLERLGDRVADGLHPRGRRDGLDPARRLELFREQAVMVWSDGVMGRKERLLLDNLRERLGIPPAAAAAIEHEAARAAGPSKASSLSSPAGN